MLQYHSLVYLGSPIHLALPVSDVSHVPQVLDEIQGFQFLQDCVQPYIEQRPAAIGTSRYGNRACALTTPPSRK